MTNIWEPAEPVSLERSVYEAERIFEMQETEGWKLLEEFMRRACLQNYQAAAGKDAEKALAKIHFASGAESWFHHLEEFGRRYAEDLKELQEQQKKES